MSRLTATRKILLSAAAAMFVTLLFELAKDLGYPQTTLLQSHALTIVYCTVVATAATALALRWCRRQSSTIASEKANLETVIDNLPGLTCIVDKSEHFVRWNSTFERVLGYSAEELARMPATDTLLEEYRQIVPQRMFQALKAGHAHTEAAWLTRSGKRIPCYLTGVRVVIGGEPCV